VGEREAELRDEVIADDDEARISVGVLGVALELPAVGRDVELAQVCYRLYLGIKPTQRHAARANRFTGGL
jgi:hypothetical protein